MLSLTPVTLQIDQMYALEMVNTSTRVNMCRFQMGYDGMYVRPAINKCASRLRAKQKKVNF